MSTDLGERLSRSVSEALGTGASLTIDGTASGGATRRTLLGKLQIDGPPEPVVIQMATGSMESLSPEAETGLIRRAGAAGVPVAEPLLTCGADSPAGVGFTVTRRVEGETVPRHILRATDENPALGPMMTRQCAEALARLHSVDPAELAVPIPELTQPTAAAAYVEYLRGIASGLPASPVVSLGMRWLALNKPADAARPSIVHSDMRNGNLIVDPKPSQKPVGVAAIIDWELAHVGDAMEDLAWLCLRFWRFGNEAQVGGFGELEQLVANYEAAGGLFRRDAFEWWTVARTLWWCLVLTLQASVFTRGLVDSLVLAASGRRVAELEHDLLVLIDPNRPR